uniref:Contactin-5 n=1 Tax=Magallana gigas TaxID=29159 RepID=K1PXT3_MAGGI
MPPKMISVFNNEYFFPRDSILVDSSFKCQAENGQIQYVWKKDGVVVENTQFIPVDNSTGILRFVKIQTEHYGTYQCFASNTYGTSLSTPFNLKESMLGRFPIGGPEEVRCKEFEHCKIQCSGKPTCLPDSQCRVEWKIGEGTKTNVEITKRVGVDGNAAPILPGDNQMRDLVIPVGKDAIFRCEAESLPNEMPPTLPIWNKNGVDLVIAGGKYILAENSQVLTVTDVQKSDTGVYQCLSENSEGVLLKEAILKVIDPITVRKRPLDNYKIAPGDILNLAVVADTDPSLTLQYKWMFNDHQGNESEIKSNEYWKLSWPINKQLTIDVSNVTDPTILVSLAGYYIVKIYHNYDEKVINITVETDVFPTADIVEIMNCKKAVTWTFQRTLICTVIGQDSSQMPPNMTSIFNDEYSFPQDSKLTDAFFNCKAENGRVLYVWKKDGDVVQNTQFVTVNNSVGILKFDKMQNEDYGTYQCFATNDFGTTLSKPFKIMEARLGSFPTSQTEEIKCEEFKHCKVECRHKPTCLPESQCKVEWKIGEGTKTNVEINKRVGVDGNGATAVPKVDPMLVFKENGKALIGEKGVLRCMFSG